MNTTTQRRRITVIPSHLRFAERDIRKKHLRVAPYCQVSTDSEEQLNSIDNEMILTFRQRNWSIRIAATAML